MSFSFRGWIVCFVNEERVKMVIDYIVSVGVR